MYHSRTALLTACNHPLSISAILRFCPSCRTNKHKFPEPCLWGQPHYKCENYAKIMEETNTYVLLICKHIRIRLMGPRRGKGTKKQAKVPVTLMTDNNSVVGSVTTTPTTISTVKIFTSLPLFQEVRVEELKVKSHYGSSGHRH